MIAMGAACVPGIIVVASGGVLASVLALPVVVGPSLAVIDGLYLGQGYPCRLVAHPVQMQLLLLR